MSINTYHITFPSAQASGPAFHAEAEAPTEDLAVRAVLEHCASQGVELNQVVLKNICGLDGALLDGLKLTRCKLEGVDLSGASLRRAAFKNTTLYAVLANERTHLDDAVVWGVEFDGCTMNGINAPRLNADGLQFFRCTMDNWHVQDAVIDGLKAVLTCATGWKASMLTLRNCNDFVGILERADLTENEKAAVRSMSMNGDRTAARTFFEALEAQDAAANA